MNDRIFNQEPGEIVMTGFGIAPDDSYHTFASDSGGGLLISPMVMDVYANGLDIRDLDPARDTVAITASSLDIRNLSGGQDSVEAYGNFNVSDSQSQSFLIAQTFYLLTKNVGSYKYNSYVIQNTGTGLAVTVTLQIAPVDIDAYYVNDGSSFQIISGATLTFVPTRLSKYARLQVSTLALGSVQAFYFGAPGTS